MSRDPSVRGLRWALLLSWMLFGFVYGMQRAQIDAEVAIEKELRRAVLFGKALCRAEHKLGRLAERVCLPCEEVQRDWIRLLGGDPAQRPGKAKPRVVSGHVGGSPLDEERR